MFVVVHVAQENTVCTGMQRLHTATVDGYAKHGAGVVVHVAQGRPGGALSMRKICCTKSTGAPSAFILRIALRQVGSRVNWNLIFCLYAIHFRDVEVGGRGAQKIFQSVFE